MKSAPGNIRALALDVDGTLTDGGFWWGPDGEEWKRFCFADVMGVARALRAGLSVTLISGEDSPLVDRFALKLGLEDTTKGCRDKARALRDFADRQSLALGEICFMGDDVNDLPAMEVAGFSAAPAGAQPPVQARADYVTKAHAGHGAVRELIEVLLLARESNLRVAQSEEAFAPSHSASSRSAQGNFAPGRCSPGECHSERSEGPPVDSRPYRQAERLGR